jgi:hypothetical protein
LGHQSLSSNDATSLDLPPVATLDHRDGGLGHQSLSSNAATSLDLPPVTTVDIRRGKGKGLAEKRSTIKKTFRVIEVWQRKRILGGLKAYLQATDYTSSNIISRDIVYF